jgi:hypothetical protein
MILIETGPLDDGGHELETTLSLDPALPTVHRLLARVAVSRRDWPRAYDLIAQSRTIDGPFSYMSNTLRYALWNRDEERLERTLAELENTQERPVVSQAMLDMYRQRHQPDKQTPMMQFAFNQSAGWRRTAYFLQVEAELAAYARADERVRETFRQCTESKLQDLVWFDYCPLFDPYRSMPEFVQARAVVAARAQLVVEAYRAR